MNGESTPSGTDLVVHARLMRKTTDVKHEHRANSRIVLLLNEGQAAERYQETTREI